MLADCGEQWRRRYFCNEVIAPGVALIVGKGTHYSTEHNLSWKLEHGVPLSREEVVQIAVDSVKNDLQLEVRFDEDEDPKKAGGQAIDQAVALSGLHYDEVAPEIHPVSVERKFLIDMRGYPYDYAGALDIEEMGAALRETKTSSPQRKWKKERARNATQISGYAFAYHVLHGKLPSRITIDNLVKKKTPEYNPVRTERTEEDLQAFVRRFEVACQTIEKQIFLPCSPEHWRCSRKWCGYYETCPYVRGKDRPKT